MVALVGLGIWRRQQLVDERDAARAARAPARSPRSRRTQRELERTVRRAGELETANVGVRARRPPISARWPTASPPRSRRWTHERDDAVLAAYAANGQVGTLAPCLDGINRALNQVSVGDPGSVRTLDSVRSACRAVA